MTGNNKSSAQAKDLFTQAIFIQLAPFNQQVLLIMFNCMPPNWLLYKLCSRINYLINLSEVCLSSLLFTARILYITFKKMSQDDYGQSFTFKLCLLFSAMSLLPLHLSLNMGIFYNTRYMRDGKCDILVKTFLSLSLLHFCYCYIIT